jgi:hypothetical protein
MIYTAYLQVMFLAGKYGVHPATLSLIALELGIRDQVVGQLDIPDQPKLRCDDSVSQHVTAS